MFKTNTQLRCDIEDELDWDPRLQFTAIEVLVHQGSVTLLGSVNTHPQRSAAVEAAKRVFGTRRVLQNLSVKLTPETRRSDTELRDAAVNALEWDVAAPAAIVVNVRRGVVTLEGEVRWNCEREAAERAVTHLVGVTDVENLIVLRPCGEATRLKERVEAALRRQAATCPNPIRIYAEGTTITLVGLAHSWQAIDAAAVVAWAAPGITNVVKDVKMHVA